MGCDDVTRIPLATAAAWSPAPRYMVDSQVLSLLSSKYTFEASVSQGSQYSSVVSSYPEMYTLTCPGSSG